MEIESSPLFKEATAIMQGGQSTSNLGWEAIIHYGTNETYVSFQVISVNRVRNYLLAFTDEISITLQMPLGVYARLIYPNRLTLQITLTRVPLKEIGSTTDSNAKIQSERFSAVLIDGERSPTIGQGVESNDQTALDLTQVADINFQLYDKALEQIRVMQTGGICRSTTVQNALVTTLSNHAKSAVVDGNRAINGVDMVEADNKDQKGAIVITQGTRVIDLADFMQSRIGIYNSGIGSYIQNKYWYIYPLFDTTEFNKRDKSLTIMVLPKRKFSNIERTFKIKGSSVTILITGETGFKDDSGTQYLNHGNGVRFADAATLLEMPGNTSSNKTSILRDKNNSEFVAGAAIAGVNNAPVNANRITANPFTIFSSLAARNGGMFKCTWENSDSSLIIPGMVTKIIYVDGDEIKSVYGVMLAVTEISHKASGIGTTKFVNNTFLSIFVNSQVTKITT